MATSTGHTTAATNTSSTATSTCLSTGAACGVPSAETLYLFTFLATMLLLTIIGSGFVARSVQLRRRQRHLLANPPEQRVKPEPALKPKPRIYDVHLRGAVAENDIRDWESIMPLSATTATARAAPSETKPSYPPAAEIDAVPAEETISARPTFWRRQRILQPANVNIPIPSPDKAPSIIPCSEKISLLRADIAYIIVMPEPKSDDEEDWPFFEFGVAEVDVAGNADALDLSFDSGEEVKPRADSVDSTPHAEP
ncbi:hypothetical protein B0H12DRAFT_1109064 [Mycena haematopus]|nr:hypothetical protein B0H12DRAFT_1109064 [Mycena haematopus]